MMRADSWLKDKRVFVTGATGFVGINLVSKLMEAGASVHVMARDATKVVFLRKSFPLLHISQGDIRDAVGLKKMVMETAPDVVFHCATARSTHPEFDRDLMFDINVRGAEHLIQACVAARPAKVVVLSSSLEYGHRNIPLTEDMPCVPESLHGATRAASTILFQQAACGAGLPIVILRLFSIYGPWEPDHRLIPTAILAGLQGRELHLTGPGIRRDYIHVNDVVQACFMAAQAENVTGEIINVGTGVQTTNEKVVEVISELSGDPIKIIANAYPLRKTDTVHWVADTCKCERLLGWKPAINLRSGLKDAIDWFRAKESGVSLYAC